MKLVLDDGDEDVGGHGAPDLGLHCVLAGAQEALDVQVLLDPLEEQFDLPSAFVQRGDRLRWQCCIVGQEVKRRARLGVLEANASQMFRIGLGRVVTIEHHTLIADHAAVALSGARVHAPRVHAFLGACDEEGTGLMHRLQPCEVHIAAIHRVESARLHGQDVLHVDSVQLCVADVDEGRDRTTQVQQRVQLDGCLDRNGAQSNRARHRLMVVESSA